MSLLDIIGKSGTSLLVHQKALGVASHNISNTNTPGYSRQVVNLSQTPRELGISVEITHIERVRDIFLDMRINEETENLSSWEAINDKLHRIELIYNEPGEINIRTLLDEFWAALEDLANKPEDAAPREMVKQKGITVADAIRHTYTRISAVQEIANQEIKERVEQINIYASKIAGLSKKIQFQMKRGVNPPNDLLDRRDMYIEELSRIGDLRIERIDPDDFKISVNGLVVAQGDRFYPVEARVDPQNQDFVEIYSKVTGERAEIRGGELEGLFLVRDEFIPFHLDRLDELAITLIDRFNEIHRAGFGLDNTTNVNFFQPFLERDEDAIFKVTGSATGYVDDVKAPLRTDPYLNISPYIDPVFSGKLEINGRLIPYDPAFDSLEDIVKRINEARCGVIASISPANRLVLTATAESGYRISSLSDYVEADFRESWIEVASGPEVIDLDKGFGVAIDRGYGTNPFVNSITGTVTINNTTFNIADYNTVQNLMDAINDCKEAGVTITYDKEKDRFKIRSDNLGEKIDLREAQVISASVVSNRGRGVGLDLDTAIIHAGFRETPVDNIITINGYEFRIDVSVDTVREVMNRINHSACGVAIVYDKWEDKFSLIRQKDKMKEITIQQNKEKGFFGITNLSRDDTEPHKYIGFLSGIKIYPEPTGGNLFHKLGILEERKKYIAFNPLYSLKNLEGEYMKTPRQHTASRIALSSDVLQDINKIAAAKGKDTSTPLDGAWDVFNGIGDGQNALELAALSYKRLLLEGSATFGEFTHFLISKTGADAQKAEKATKTQELILSNLEGLRDAISGVSLDEEMVNLVKYQHGFNASARVIAVMTGLLDRVIALGA